MDNRIIIAAPAVLEGPAAPQVAEPTPAEGLAACRDSVSLVQFANGHPGLWQDDNLVLELYRKALEVGVDPRTSDLLARRLDVLSQLIVSDPSLVERFGTKFQLLKGLLPQAKAAVISYFSNHNPWAGMPLDFLGEAMSGDVDQALVADFLGKRQDIGLSLVEKFAENGIPEWASPLVLERLGQMLVGQVRAGTPLANIEFAGDLEKMLPLLGVRLTPAEEAVLVGAYEKMMMDSHSEFDVNKNLLRLCGGELGRKAFKQAANKMDKAKAWPIYFARDDADKEFALDGFSTTWVMGSRYPASQAAQMAAIEQLPGAEPSTLYFSPNVGPEYFNQDVLRSICSDKGWESTKQMLTDAYWKTQEYLTGQGLSSIRLFRGVRSSVEMPSVLESWTSSDVQGERFDGYEVLEANVPIYAVLMGYFTPGVEGVFIEDEYEYVVIRSRVPQSAYVMPRRERTSSIIVAPGLTKVADVPAQAAPAAPVQKAPVTIQDLQSLPEEGWADGQAIATAYEKLLSLPKASPSLEPLLSRRIDVLSGLLSTKPWLAHENPQVIPFGDLSANIVAGIAKLAVDRDAGHVLDILAAKNPGAAQAILGAMEGTEPLRLVRMFAEHLNRPVSKLFFAPEVAAVVKRAVLGVLSSKERAVMMAENLRDEGFSMEAFLGRLGMDAQMEQALVRFFKESFPPGYDGNPYVEAAFQKMCGGEIGRKVFVDTVRKLPKEQAKDAFYVREDFSPKEIGDILLSKWTANSRLSSCQVIQAVAQDLWKGQPVSLYFPHYMPKDINAQTINEVTTPAAAQAAGQALTSMYQRTQQTIQSLLEFDPNVKYTPGQATVRLYRGLEADVNIPSVFDSWTSDKFVAKEQFDGWETIAADVPLSAILVSYLSDDWADLGAGESEYIVIRALMPDSSVVKRIPGPDKKALERQR